MYVPVSTTVEVFGKPAEYKSGEMNAMAGDGERKVAFIIGTTGQDGSYLVEFLLQKGRSFLRYSHAFKLIPWPNCPRRRDRRGAWGGLPFRHESCVFLSLVRSSEE